MKTPIPREIVSSLVKKEKDYLLSRMRKRTGSNPRGCFIWKGEERNGYGVMSWHNYPVYLHRLSFLIHNGEIPEGKSVLHECDNRRCWNPAHLFAGTQLENVRDMIRKGRGSTPPVRYGLDNHKANLTDAQVKEIRRDFGTMNQRDQAKKYGVSQSTIWRIGHTIVREVL